MRQINTSLKALMLEGEGQNESKFQSTIDGETFEINFSMGKDGINLELIPTNPEGNMILNLSEDELRQMQGTLKNSLTTKFSRYRIKMNDGDSNVNAKSLKFSIPTNSLVEFLKGVMNK